MCVREVIQEGIGSRMHEIMSRKVCQYVFELLITLQINLPQCKYKAKAERYQVLSPASMLLRNIIAMDRYIYFIV